MNPLHPTARLTGRHLPWPLPAIACWALAWAVCALLAGSGAAPALAWAAGALAGSAAAAACAGAWRRLIAAAGFPLAAWVQGAAAAWPAWAWLLLALPLLAAYPLRAWRDAPFFPTPADALQGLDRVLPAPRRVLDAGCGLGHGLRACRRLWPGAALTGVEWSPLLAAVARVLCPWAHVRRADMWATPWTGHDLVYVFQRPESMARVWAKACAELPAGGWVVSLEFAVPDLAPQARLHAPGRRPLWVYRVPVASAASTVAPCGR